MKKHFQCFLGIIVGAILFGGLTAYAAGITALPKTAALLIDGQEVDIEGYVIEGHHYFQLRDFILAMVPSGKDASVVWDGENKRVLIDTSRGYDPDEQYSPEVTSAPAGVTVYSDGNWPVVGATPGNILLDPSNPVYWGAARFHEPYSYDSIGQCTWYAAGRFYEVHDIFMAACFMGNPKDWIDNIKTGNVTELIADLNVCSQLDVVTEIKDVRALSIATFKPKDSSAPGHAVFIEYVERDAQGNPTYVYITEANGSGSNNGKYDPGVDCIVQKIPYNTFISKYGLLGYIIPKQ